MTLDQANLKDILDYDPATGIFRWRDNRGSRARAGKIAGSPDGYGSREIRIGVGRYKASHLAFLYMTGDWPIEIVKHRNGDSADNRWINLYEATWAESKRLADSQKRKAA